MTHDPNWLNLTLEKAIEPDLPICDPHHHLWEYPNSIYLVEELLQDLRSGHNVVKTVHVECDGHYRTTGAEHLFPVGETEFVERLTRPYQRHPKIAAGIVGHADLCLGDAVKDVLEAHMLASSRFRGIRHASAWHESNKVRNSHTQPIPRLLQDHSFLVGFRQLEKLELSFDAMVYFEQIPELTELARVFTNTPIVLNHIGAPIGIGPYVNKREQVFAQWRTNIIGLSACENVFIKLGGMTMTMSGFGWHRLGAPPSSDLLAEAMAPYIHTCIKHFGVQRCMFESNFPMDRASCSYSVLWNAFKKVSWKYSSEERAHLFHDTACRFYKI